MVAVRAFTVFLPFLFCLSVYTSLCLAQPNTPALRSASLSLWGDLPDKGFKPSPHVWEEAPKGGVLRLSVVGTYDSLNPFAARGLGANRLSLTYETLGETSLDNGFTIHGLLASTFELAADRSQLIAHIHPEARFSDGKPVLAEDVVYSFYALTSEASPTYKAYYAKFDKVEALGERSVLFVFAETDNRELPLIVCQLPVLPKHWWQKRKLGEPQSEAFPGSGPYRVHKATMGSAITYERNPDWWGKYLPINKGRYNFDRIQIDYYRDQSVAREAFLAGETDLFVENTIKDWVNSYQAKAVQQGLIRREEVVQHRAAGMSGFFMNTRKSPLSNKKVREALQLVFDFEWVNRSLFYGAYSRNNSFFSNSSFAAPDVPQGRELELLHKLAPTERLAELVQPLGGLPFASEAPHKERLKKALNLLQQAGWRLEKGRLLDPRGKQLALSFMLSSPSLQRVVMPYKQHLQRIGVNLEIQLVDQSQYIARLRAFDFDMINATVRQSESPGNEQRNFWSTNAAVTPGSRNYAGVNDPLVDALALTISTASSQQELLHAVHALDRVLLHGSYVVPGWFSPSMRVAWWGTRISPPPLGHPRSGLDLTSWYAARQ